METQIIPESINLIINKDGKNIYHSFYVLKNDKETIEKCLQKAIQEIMDMI
jgi:hypothetical protein